MWPGKGPVGHALPRRAVRAMAGLAALLAFGWADTSRADDLSALFDPGTIISVGGLVGSGPRFQGGNKAGLWGLPYLSFRRPDEPREWWSPDDGVGVSLLGDAHAQAGVVLDFREGRDLKDDRRLVGLPKLPVTIGLGLYGEVWPIIDILRLRAELTQGVRADDGLVAKLSADLIGRVGRLTVSGGPRVVMADSAAMRLDFDVPVGTSLLNPQLTPFRASAGLRSVGATLGASYDWSADWQTITSVRYDRLVRSAEASPIVRRIGTADQVTVSTGAVYSFSLNP